MNVREIIVEYKQKINRICGEEEDLNDRKYALSAQDFLFEILWKRNDTKMLKDVINCLRDERLQSNQSLFYGTNSPKYINFSTSYCDVLQTDKAIVLGCGILKQPQRIEFAVVLLLIDKRIVMASTRVPIASLESEFLHGNPKLNLFEQGMASEEASTVEASHSAVAAYLRNIGAHQYPFNLFSETYYLKIEGPLPMLALKTPENIEEFQLCLNVLEDLCFGGVTLQEAYGDYIEDFISNNERQVEIDTFFFSQGPNRNKKPQVEEVKLHEHHLMRPVVSHMAMLLFLRRESEKVINASVFEVRLRNLLENEINFTDEETRTIKEALNSMAGRENMVRFKLLKKFRSTPNNLMPLSDNKYKHVEDLLQKPFQSIPELICSSIHELPCRILPFIEQGCEVSSLVQNNFVLPVELFLRTLSSMIEEDQAIILLRIGGMDESLATQLTVFTNNSVYDLSVSEISRFMVAPWATVLVLKNDSISKVSTVGFESRKLKMKKKTKLEDTNQGRYDIFVERIEEISSMLTTYGKCIRDEALGISKKREPTRETHEQQIRIKRFRAALLSLKS